MSDKMHEPIGGPSWPVERERYGDYGTAIHAAAELLDRDWDMEYAPYTEAESEAFSQAIRGFAEKHGIELPEAADSGDGKPGIYVGGLCWCGGPVGPREPGDSRGLGCLENIMHEMEEKK